MLTHTLYKLLPAHLLHYVYIKKLEIHIYIKSHEDEDVIRICFEFLFDWS